MTNSLISDILFLHTASLKSRCFLFIFIILVFILDSRLVRKLVFLYFNVNVYLKEITVLKKFPLPYLTGGYKALPWVTEVTRGYRRFQGVTRNYKGLQVVGRGYMGLQGVTRGYRRFQEVKCGHKGIQGLTRVYKRLQGARGTYKGLHGVRRQDKTRQDNVLFGVLYNPMYIDFIQII